MIQALIIDDQETNITVLKSQLGKFFPQIAIAGVSTDPEEAVSMAETLMPDLLFLDIQMPGLNGFDFLEKLNRHNRAEVIFVTAHSEYALKAFEHQAAGYITKPVNAETLVLTVNKVIRHIQDRKDRIGENRERTEDRKIALSSQKGLIFVAPESIYYCESSGNYTNFFLKDQKQVLVSKQIGHVEQFLPRQHFMRIHDRYIINLNHIKAYNRGSGGTVILENDVELPVSIRRKEGLLRYFE